MDKLYERVLYLRRFLKKREGFDAGVPPKVETGEHAERTETALASHPKNDSAGEKTVLNPSVTEDFEGEGKRESGWFKPREWLGEGLKWTGRKTGEGLAWSGRKVAEGARWVGNEVWKRKNAILNNEFVKWSTMTAAVAMLMLDVGGAGSFIASVLTEEVALISSWLPHIGAFLSDQVVTPVLQYAFGAPSWDKVGVLAVGAAVFYLKPWRPAQNLFKKK